MSDDGLTRVRDSETGSETVRLQPGQYYVSKGTDEVIVTVLGSCVSACIRDPKIGVGGMNHFMLPAGADAGPAATSCVSVANRYGNFAMENLINAILRSGGERSRLELKLAGGGNILVGMTDIGQRNIDFIRTYVANEGLCVVGEDLGDVHPRKLYYYPDSGRVRVKRLAAASSAAVVREEQSYQATLADTEVEGDVELF